MSAANKTWRLSWFSLVVSVIALIGVGLVLYPSAAAWISQYNQSHTVSSYSQEVAQADPSAQQLWEQAQAYNATLASGAVVAADQHKPTAGSDNDASSSSRYENLLSVDDTGLMGRIKIDAIDVDLPIYHGTSDETLTRGIGHLEGTSLPVGGVGTRSVLTGHRGLSSSTLFTNLNLVKKGDRFTLEILDQVLTYEVNEVKIVEPDETQALIAQKDRDLVTLVTCTPLGINSQRILVTGERVTPTPIADVEAGGEKSDLPGFPWWVVILALCLGAIGLWIWRSGIPRMAKRA